MDQLLKNNDLKKIEVLDKKIPNTKNLVKLLLIQKLPRLKIK